MCTARSAARWLSALLLGMNSARFEGLVGLIISALAINGGQKVGAAKYVGLAAFGQGKQILITIHLFWSTPAIVSIYVTDL